MQVLWCRNVREALPKGLLYLSVNGQWENSRAGRVLVAPGPVTTVYQKPTERVLLDPLRDANPFFHLFESIWMLAGRNDARWLDRFVKDFSSRFAEDDGKQHGAYGFRWRHHFDLEGGGNPFLPDQLETIIKLLRNNPQDRQAVLTMWDPAADLGVQGLKDRPCNTHIYFRIREDSSYKAPSYGDDSERLEHRPVLDITVCCRSNDLVWGVCGSNSVHFSILQEYMAARIGVGVGRHFQISNNCHVYEDIYEKMKTIEMNDGGDYGLTTPIVEDASFIDEDINTFMEWSESEEASLGYNNSEYANSWFSSTAVPLFVANSHWKAGRKQEAIGIVGNPNYSIAPDWRQAALEWMQRRYK